MSQPIKLPPPWKPMSEAPKDGTEIYAACFEDDDCIVKWREDCQGWMNTTTERFRIAVAWIPKPHLSDFIRKQVVSAVEKD